MPIPSNVRVFQYPPNWFDRFMVTYRYKTNVIESRSGREQRRALRRTPRKTIEFSIQLRGRQFRDFKVEMAARQDREFLFSEETDSSRSPSGMAPMGTTMHIVPLPAWAKPGASVVLRNDKIIEARLIASVSGEVVTFDSATPTDWPAGTRVSPGRYGRVPSSFEVSHQTSDVATATIVADVTPTSEDYETELGDPILYDDVDLWLKRPNWAAPPEITHVKQLDVLDFEKGKTEYFSAVPFDQRQIQLTYLARDRREVVDLMVFFRRMRGRRGSFFMPTWENDIQIVSPIPAAPLFGFFAEGETLALLNGNPAHARIAVLTRSGEAFVRKVLSLTAVAGSTYVDLDARFPAHITAEDFVMVCWLPLWRLSADELTIEWLTDEVAQFVLNATQRPESEVQNVV